MAQYPCEARKLLFVAFATCRQGLGFPDSLAFLGFLVLKKSLVYRIDIREGGGKLNAFIILHEIQAVSPSPPRCEL